MVHLKITRYTVVFFPIQAKVIFLFFNNRNQVSYFCNSIMNSTDL